MMADHTVRKISYDEKKARKAAHRIAQAAELGISVRELVKRNKAKASSARRAADSRRDLIADVEIHLAEIKWRGLVIPGDAVQQLRRATSKAGFREIGEANIRALLTISGEAIRVAAHANAKRILNAAMGSVESLH